ncbi:hypothetical protein ACFP1I_21870 [Dyadobacter subterraneus]|uniref:Uncharacterized protein n=1 Tax=Dyadobacter subterraneus TaxID=2773304 RepID=A0ABR9W551_9BACT|nr:hypothetical protein [Dyadobacter subterraneus]MBE9460588.1 hypothetical protein [Dyadobacter subterraneus]
MKKIEEQLEGIEEILSVLIKKTSAIEGLIQRSDQVPDATNNDMIAEIKSHVLKLPTANVLLGTLTAIQKNIQFIPRETKVENYHHFDLKSKGFIISAAILLIVSTLCIGMAVSSFRENSRLQASDLKYRMIRQVYPGIGAWADSTYFRDPQSAESETQKLEARELVLKDAEKLLKQKQQETENAQNILKKLRKE